MPKQTIVVRPDSIDVYVNRCPIPIEHDEEDINASALIPLLAMMEPGEEVSVAVLPDSPDVVNALLDLLERLQLVYNEIPLTPETIAQLTAPDYYNLAWVVGENEVGESVDEVLPLTDVEDILPLSEEQAEQILEMEEDERIEIGDVRVIRIL